MIEAVGKLVDHLNANPKTIDLGKAIQSNPAKENELFQMLAHWRCSSDDVIKSISNAIANSWANLQRPEFSGKTEPHAGSGPALKVWEHVCEVLRQLDPKHEIERVKGGLDSQELAAVKAVGGFIQVANRDTFTAKYLKTDFTRPFVICDTRVVVTHQGQICLERPNIYKHGNEVGCGLLYLKRVAGAGLNAAKKVPEFHSCLAPLPTNLFATFLDYTAVVFLPLFRSMRLK